jgi:hypothetical protein
MLLILPNAYHKIYIGNIVTPNTGGQFFDVDMGELTEDHIRRLAWGVEFRMNIKGIPNGAYLQTPCTIFMLGTLNGKQRAASN